MRLQQKIWKYTQNSLLFSVQSEQLTRLKGSVTAFLTAARYELHENTQLMIYFSFSQVPARWRKRAATLCDIFISSVAFNWFTDTHRIFQIGMRKVSFSQLLCPLCSQEQVDHTLSMQTLSTYLWYLISLFSEVPFTSVVWESTMSTLLVWSWLDYCLVAGCQGWAWEELI